MEVARREFTAIMGSLPTGVVVVASVDEHGTPHGITVNSICSVSIAPPLLIACVSHTSRTLGVLREQGRFLVNILASGSAEVSKVFASKIPDKFSCVNWKLTERGNALLHNNIVAYAECTVINEWNGGDHAIILGRVEGGQGPVSDAQPLLYYQRHYDRWPIFD